MLWVSWCLTVAMHLSTWMAYLPGWLSWSFTWHPGDTLGYSQTQDAINKKRNWKQKKGLNLGDSQGILDGRQQSKIDYSRCIPEGFLMKASWRLPCLPNKITEVFTYRWLLGRPPLLTLVIVAMSWEPSLKWKKNPVLWTSSFWRFHVNLRGDVDWSLIASETYTPWN